MPIITVLFAGIDPSGVGLVLGVLVAFLCRMQQYSAALHGRMVIILLVFIIFYIREPRIDSVISGQVAFYILFQSAFFFPYYCHISLGYLAR